MFTYCLASLGNAGIFPKPNGDTHMKRTRLITTVAPHAWTGRYNWLFTAVPVTIKGRRLAAPKVAA